MLKRHFAQLVIHASLMLSCQVNSVTFVAQFYKNSFVSRHQVIGVSNDGEHQFGTNFHRICKARTLGNSLNVHVVLRADYLVCVRQEPRVIDVDWRHALQMDLLTYLPETEYRDSRVCDKMGKRSAAPKGELRRGVHPPYVGRARRWINHKVWHMASASPMFLLQTKALFLVWPSGTHCRQPYVTHHWHRLRFVHSSRPCCSEELMKHYHSTSVTV